MDKIILIGAGGHARACIDVIELSCQFKVAGLIDKEFKEEQENLGYSVIGIDKDLQSIRKKYSYAIITVGQIKSSNIRVRLFHLLKELNYILPVIISPRAYVSNRAKIGEGSIVMHDAIINASASIGKNCIINSKALIEHDAVIGDNCHISTGAIVNGEVAVGNESFIGSGVLTKQCISIGNNCIIGAGVILKSDIESNQIIKK